MRKNNETTKVILARIEQKLDDHLKYQEEFNERIMKILNGHTEKIQQLRDSQNRIKGAFSIIGAIWGIIVAGLSILFRKIL
jgi:hypothetical protein